jgi:Glycosyltransferase like family
MIAFGVAVGEVEPYSRYCHRGIQLAAEPDSEVFRFAAVGSLARSYNLLLEAAAAYDDLEGLVIVHPYAEIVDPDFCAKVRQALSDPEVGVVGCVGATGVRSIAWWEGSVRSAPVIQRYTEHGGGEVPAYSWAHPEMTPGDVEAVDAFLLVLSPWAVRTVRFDEELVLGHGSDVDYCLEVRAAGRKVAVADLRVIHHRTLDLINDLEIWIEAHIQLAEKWESRIPGAEMNGIDWKQRARRAEAEREAARAIAHSNYLASDARVLELERAWKEMSATLSWRITEPLRLANRWRRAAVQRLRGRPDQSADGAA